MVQALVLHVEDDSDDAFFVAKAFRKAQVACEIRRMKNGLEAVDYLGQAATCANPDCYPVPNVVLLDLKLPDVSGFEVLQWGRAQTSLQRLPIVILSGSPVQEDQQRARQLGADAYFVKSPDYADVIAFVGRILHVECAQNVSPQPAANHAAVLGSAIGKRTSL